MGVGALQADAGIEMHLFAAEPPALLEEPVEQTPSMAAAPGLGKR